MIVCVGEILLELEICKDPYAFNFVGVPGGDTFIVASDISLIGGDACFYGVVGEDYFGKYLIQKAKDYPLKSLHIFTTKHANTTLLVSYADEEEKQSELIRSPGADSLFDKDLKLSIHKGDIVHFGSFLLSNKKGRVVINSFIKQIKKAGCLSSFDVNLKLDLYENKIEARNVYLSALKEFDIIKMSEEEFLFLARNQKVGNFYKTYLKKDALLFITKGVNGSVCYYKTRSYEATCLPLNMVDPSGAGDAFFARCLVELDSRPHKNNFDDVNFSNLLTDANIDGAEATQYKGALKQMPK